MAKTERLTTAGICYKDGLYLVAQRLPGGLLSEKWEFVGGKNRWGESVEDTLKREWLEELSLSIEPLEFLLETEFTNNDVHYTLHCHRVRLVEGEITLKVHKGVRWVTLEDLEKLDFGPSDGVIRDWIISHPTYFLDSSL